MNSFWPTWREHKLFSVLITLLLVALVMFVGMKAWNGWKEQEAIGRVPRDRDTITIQGEGKVTGEPTLAEVSVGLYSEGRDVPETQNQNAQRMNAMIAAMKDLGIAEADLQTSNYTISPRYEYKDGIQNVIGYTVSQNLSVKARDLSKVGAVLSKVGQLGANQVNGVTFTIDDPKELQQEARKKALEDARKKAQELAQALGVKIVRVTTFSEISPSSPSPYPYATGLKVTSLSVSTPPAIQPGSLDVTSQVSVTFEIQ